MDNDFIIPEGFWKSVCEDVNHPLACVDLENRFRWVNRAYELLLGYSYGELIGRTWMEVTEQKDIGPDWANVQAIIRGDTDAYTMQKDYRHKNGRKIKVSLTVRRFPESMLQNMICFRVETPKVYASHQEIDEVRDSLMGHLNELKAMVLNNRKYEDNHRIEVNVDKSIGGDSVGRDKNSDASIKIMMGGLVAIIALSAWLMYYVAVVANKHPVHAPPSVVQPQK